MAEVAWVKNSQDAEGDVVVAVVVPVVVHVRETTVVGVADDEPVVGVVGFTSASRVALAHPYSTDELTSA